MASPPSEARDARGRGRELALGVLCSIEDRDSASVSDALSLVAAKLLQDPPAGEAAGEDAFARLAADPAVGKAARVLLEHYETKSDEVDVMLRDASRRWRLERMDQVDRNVLRLAAVELAYAATPTPVILSEAVRLASRYGSERSARFVNGVAQTLAERVRPAGAAVEGS